MLEKLFSKSAERFQASNSIGALFGNFIFLGLLITIILVIIVLIFAYDKLDKMDIVKIFVYSGIVNILLMFLADYYRKEKKLADNSIAETFIGEKIPVVMESNQELSGESYQEHSQEKTQRVDLFSNVS